jgi:hypothetical protein
MIWEYTQPVAHMIEDVICEDEAMEGDEYRDVVMLHVLAPLSTRLDFDFASRVVEERAVKPQPVPTALSLC